MKDDLGIFDSSSGMIDDLGIFEERPGSSQEPPPDSYRVGIEGAYSGEMPVLDPHEPTRPAESAIDYGRVIGESAYKTAIGAMEFPGRFGYEFGERIEKAIEDRSLVTGLSGVGEEIGENILGFARFMGEPVGAYGFEKMKERWATDPFGSALGAVGAAGVVRGTKRAVWKKKGVPPPPAPPGTPIPEIPEGVDMEFGSRGARVANPEELPPTGPYIGETLPGRAEPTPHPYIPGRGVEFAPEGDRVATPEQLPPRGPYVGETIPGRGEPPPPPPPPTSGPTKFSEPPPPPEPPVHHKNYTEPKALTDVQKKHIDMIDNAIGSLNARWKTIQRDIEGFSNIDRVSAKEKLDKIGIKISKLLETREKLIPNPNVERLKKLEAGLTALHEQLRKISEAKKSPEVSGGRHVEVARDDILKRLGEDAAKTFDMAFDASKRDVFGKIYDGAQAAKEYALRNKPQSKGGVPPPLELDKLVAEKEAKLAEIKKNGPLGNERGSSQLLTDIAKKINDSIDKNKSLKEKLEIAETFVIPSRQIKDQAVSALERMKTVGAVISDAVRRPREFAKEKFTTKQSDYLTVIGDYLFARTETGIAAGKFARSMNKAFKPERQEAMRKWYLADGNEALIKSWAGQIEDPALKKMYTDALSLTPEEKAIAQDIKRYHGERLQELTDLGILEHGVENYLRRIWKKDPAVDTFINEMNAGMFRKNPSIFRKRLYETEIEAELKGKRLKDYRIGHSVTSYDIDFNEAIAARKAIAEMVNGTASDGRPLVVPSGASRIVTGEQGRSLIIRPKAHPKGTNDYRYIDHPSLRSWKWKGGNAEKSWPLTVDDTLIVYEGDLLVHSEIYKHLNNMLGKSKAYKYPSVKAAMDLSREFKNTLLSLSGFHQTQIAIHAAFHKVNPFNAPEIDLTHPDQALLVKTGLQIHSHRALAEFGEGLYSSGLVNRTPGIGIFAQKYGSYLFESFIPRVKMKMGVEALARNRARYKGKLTDWEIAEKTASQANAAFGELNLKWMGRSPTIQDGLRLALLAPDFLEARARFAGQAVSPYGREQTAALVRGGIAMYVSARVLNQIFDNDPHWDQPFGIVVDGTEYSVRSIPGDIQHLVSDPRSFVYHRLNPTTAKPAVEFVTGRDVFGRERSTIQQVKDVFTGVVPIPLQGFTSGRSRTVWQSVLASLGIQSWKDTTGAEKLARKLHSSNIPKGALSSEDQERLDLRYKVTELFREGKKQEAIEYAKKNGMSNDDLVKANTTARIPKIVFYFKNLNPTQAMEVWNEATDEERILIGSAFYSKLLSDTRISPSKKIKYIQQIKRSRQGR